MPISRLAIRRPVALLMCVLTIVVFGFVALRSMPVDLISDINMPIATVFTSYPGASPTEVESLVTSPLEDSLMTMPGLSELSSVSNENYSLIILQFSYGSDLDRLMLTVREKVDAVRNDLPEGAKSPVASQVNVNDMPVCVVAVTGADESRLLRDVKEQVVPAFERIDGVASVAVSGGISQEIAVEVKPEALQAYGLSQAEIAQLVGASYVNLPIGSLPYGSRELLTRGEYKFSSAAEVAAIPVVTHTGAVLRMDDVATVSERDAAPETLGRLDGKPAVLLTINKQQSGNALAIAESATKVVVGYADNKDFTMALVANQGKLIEDSVMNVASSLIYGGLLAVLVLWVILGQLKLAGIIGTAIPISVMATFFAMYFSGLTLNIVSLAGLVIAVGMMVDNSIVILESIFTCRAQGMEPRKAAAAGTRAVGEAVMASTLTTVSVFLPILFIAGLAREMFKQVALTITYSMLLSLLTSVTVVPCLFVLLNPRDAQGARQGKILNKIVEKYGRLVAWSTDHRFITVGIALATLAASLALIPFIGTEMLPPMDQGRVTVKVEAQRGTSIAHMEGLAERIEAVLAKYPDIAHYTATVGGTSGLVGISGTNEMTLTAYLKDDRKLSTYDIVDHLREDLANFTGADVTVVAVDSLVTAIMGNTSDMGTGGVTVSVSGADEASLRYAVQMIEEMARGVTGVIATNSSLGSGAPELKVEVDSVKAAAYGLTPASVLAEVRYAMTGVEAAVMEKSGSEYPVRVVYPDRSFATAADLEALPIESPAGVFVPLSEVAAVVQGEGPLPIRRTDNRRVMTVSAVADSTSQSVTASEFKQKLAALSLPAGIEISMGGQEMLKNEAFSGLTTALYMALLLVFMIMAAQFESMRFSAVVMLSVPMAFSGGILALLLTGTTLNLASLMGVVMLVGVVVNNAIVLIDRAGQNREAGMPIREAVIEAGIVRLRPIIMTTVTTFLGLLPLALAIGSGTELMQPMAIISMGGLLSSTLLTLLVIPCTYLISAKKK